MKILLVGSGGRENALAIKLAQSPNCSELYIAPGNPGTDLHGKNVDIQVMDIDDLVEFAKTKSIDLTIVGPEAPLVDGIVDAFMAQKLHIIGPDKRGAQLEGSKKWAKELMLKYKIPTAGAKFFSDYDSAIAYVKRNDQYPIVVKADGLAAGKGVTVAQDIKDVEKALKDCFVENRFGDAGTQVVIEDYLEGEEASILAFTDGDTVIPMVSSQDHKAIFDGDKGPNTGGMGAYSPAPIVTPQIEKQVRDDVFKPIVQALKAEGIVYKGILYAGIMVREGKPYVIEFNVRFGDPEAQVVLARLKTDLVDIFQAIDEERLSDMELEWSLDHAVCVVLVSKGYPGKYDIGKPITGLSLIEESPNYWLIHSGTVKRGDRLLTNGGRVLGVVGRGATLEKAVSATYTAVNWVQFEGKYFRKDIGAKALKAVET